MDKKPSVVIAPKSYGRDAPYAIKKLSEIFNLRRIPVDNLRNDTTDDEIIEMLDNADAIIIGGYGRINRYIMESVPSLKIIAKRGLGLDNIELDAATELGIAVIYARHTMEEISVAEHTVSLILACARRLTEANEKVKLSKYDERVDLIGIELYNKKLGIIGFGAIGRRVAQIMKNGFRMKIIAYDPYVPEEVFKEYGAEKIEDLDELMSESDVITIHIPLTSETRNLIDEERIKRIKKDAIIVNTSRGAVIDEKALANQVKTEKIFACGLDVTIKEPPEKDNPLIPLNRVIMTPHIAAFTYEALKRIDTAIAEDLIAFFKGKRPSRIANPQVFNKYLRFKI
jgi:D-3-phosphoglycerate dehydrogenase